MGQGPKLPSADPLAATRGISREAWEALIRPKVKVNMASRTAGSASHGRPREAPWCVASRACHAVLPECMRV